MSKPEMKNGVASTTTYDFHYPQPKEKETFLEFCYNKKNGTYFGRTISSWGRLLLFYMIFYAILAGLFAICLQGLFATIDDHEPKWKLDSSLIGTNPGLGFRPLSEETERGSVIQFDTKKPGEYKYWKDLLDVFVQPYNQTGQENTKVCNFGQTQDPNKVCIVDINSFGECSPEKEYGYNKGRPCVFLKLNKIFDWTPEFYSDPTSLPENMPADLVAHIKGLNETEREQIWISCEGQHSLDKENMGGIKYYPSRGFASYYYPFRNQPGYLSPLVAVQFESIKLNQLLSIECRAWAKNIIYNGSIRDRMGSVTFQLFVD
ncbi:sodium/potassium-transporting ATPase subunit beta-1 [Eupeodes corollae]|uniref:sodium/potassium-transporting ATPase subunit beta-1 n=1 Tax=Eupeodes corollae TaxID=290404 RepID=UPI002493B627|nr:sodium/potassium-transporting ATPase subunit beta-1 [Eupeodes corollae]XP_055908767.1 sodium/potassium-transporting ATPase subunit beta-1 [Eupeodes corollae]XP_055908768.1 sodium/potassium-transporting ATPase subunit beta-1 [Eupeodes corollae]